MFIFTNLRPNNGIIIVDGNVLLFTFPGSEAELRLCGNKANTCISSGLSVGGRGSVQSREREKRLPPMEPANFWFRARLT